MNQDPFASVRLKPIQTEKSQENIQDQNQDPFSSVRIKKSEDIPFLYETGRHAARIGSRIAETIGGIPGDISSLIQSGVITGLNKLTGHELSPEAHEEIRKQRLPTSGELKKFSQEKTGGFTSPQNETERFADEIAETATSLLGPMKFRKSLGIAVGSTLAKEGTKILGLGETTQEASKLGTMLMLTAINPKGALKYASSQYDKARSLAKGASIPVPKLKQNLDLLKNELEEGLSHTSKNAVLKPINEMLEKSKGNMVSVNELTSAKRDLNSIMKDPELLTREKKLLKVVGKEIDNAIKPYERINPAFKKAYRPANEIYGAVMQGTKAYDFIRKELGAKSVLNAALAEVALGHPKYVIPTIEGSVGALGVAKAGDFFVRLAKSPELQKYYTKALIAASKEDLPALRLYADKIEEEFNRSKNSPPYRSNKKK